MKNPDYENILNRFRSKEVEAIYKKYIDITEEELAAIIKLIERVEVNGIDFFDLYQNYETTSRIALDQAKESDIALLNFHIFVSVTLKLNIHIEKIKYHYEELKNKGYTKIDKYVFYYDYGISELEVIAEETLTEELEDVEKVMELFDEEEVANMWIDGTSFRETAKYYIEYNGWFETLKIESLGRAYLDKYDSELYYCLDKGGNILD